MKRRTLLASALALPALLLPKSVASCPRPAAYQTPYLPKLWAKHAAEIIDRRLHGLLMNRTLIERPADFPFENALYLYECFGFFPCDYTEEMLPLVEKAANNIADQVLAIADVKGRWIATYEMPVHNIGTYGSAQNEKVSKSARHVHNKLAVNGLLFLAEENREIEMWNGVIEMTVGFARL